jgi:hypothetical protein
MIPKVGNRFSEKGSRSSVKSRLQLPGDMS